MDDTPKLTTDESPVTQFFRNYLQRKLDEHVRPEIQALAKRGNVTLTEVTGLQCNSWEWEHLYPAMTDEAFTGCVQHALNNCARGPSPCTTYDEAVVNVYAPELLRRFNAMVRVFGSIPEADR